MPPKNVSILPLAKSQLCPTAQEATLMSIKRAYACITIACKNSLNQVQEDSKVTDGTVDDFSKTVSLKMLFSHY